MQIIDWVKRQTGKIADNVKDYKFYVKHEPSSLDSSTTLVLTTFTNRDEMATVPCMYKWSRVRNGLTTEVPEFKGSSFICQPSDIGNIIQAEITSTDPQHGGTAVLKFGPVKLDVIIKKQIDHSLATGNAFLNVDLIQKNQVKECQIKILEDQIRINHCSSNNQYIFDYSIGEPRIQASMKQPTKAIIYFSQRHEVEISKFIRAMFGEEDLSESQRLSRDYRLELRFNNRATKDNFLFIIKAFNTKKIMKNSTIMNKIEQVDMNENATFNYMIEIESLKADIQKLTKLNEKYLHDKKMYFQEARKYEKQIEEIIVTYTKIAENKCKTKNQLDQSVLELREKRDEVIDRKIQALMRENDTLHDRVAFLTQQLNGEIKPTEMRDDSRAINPTEIPKGGFIKKRKVQQNFDQILSSLNESAVKQPSPLEAQVKQLHTQKVFLAKKLNESLHKITLLESRLKKHEDEAHSAINLLLPVEDYSIQNGNKSAYNLGDHLNVDINELKKKQKLEKSNIRQNIPMVASKTEKYYIEASKKSQEEKLAVEGSKWSQNPEEKEMNRKLKEKVASLTEENEKLKDQLEMLSIQKEVLIKQKQSLETKYRKKLDEMSHQISMYRRNQDALNRSQHLSMEMDLYNEQQNKLLKQQNDLLASQNQKLSRMCQKYMKQAKQVSKLKEQVLTLSGQVKQQHKSEQI